MNLVNRLSFRLGAPVFFLTLLVWGILYFFVADCVREFAADRAQEDLRSISREVLDVCHTSNDAILKSESWDDPRELRVAKALILGQLEDLFKKFHLEGIVLGEGKSGVQKLLSTSTAKRSLVKKAGMLRRHTLETVDADSLRFFAYGFDFRPWRWRIVLLREEAAYAGLVQKIRRLYWITGALLLVMACGLIVVENRYLRGPVNEIIADLRKREPPTYEGVQEFEFLSRSIAEMMSTLADRETRLRESETRYRTIFETTGTGILIAEQDRTITLVNARFLEDTGYEREEVEGKKSWIEIVAQDDRERLREISRQRNVDPASAPRQYEFTMVDKQGVHKNVLLTGDMIPGTTQTIASLIDITDRKREELERRLEREARAAEVLRMTNVELGREIETRRKTEVSLRATEERFRAVFETAEDCIFLKNTNLEYTHVNPAYLALLGKTVPEVAGKTDEALALDPNYAAHAKRLETQTLQGETFETEHTWRGNGWTVSLNVIRFPLRDASGEIFGICGIARDVSDRRARKKEPVVTSSDPYQSPAGRELLEHVSLVARSDGTVLLLGESGAGKDHWAGLLHDMSHRSGGPFLTINCAALSPELVESELFGHEAGAFTSARSRKRGLVELAEGGTLLLNEIGEMPLGMQSKLLTFLDTHLIRRVGGETNISVDTRILAATNRDIELDAEEGRFRKDLFYRLNVFAISVPALRERMEDLPILVEEGLVDLAEKMGLPYVPDIHPSSMDALMRYHWPGNIRELRNVLERALILSGKETISVDALGLKENAPSEEEEETPTPLDALFPESVTFHDAVEETKRLIISRALDRSSGTVKDAADLLGMTRNSIDHHMRRLGIQRPRNDTR